MKNRTYVQKQLDSQLFAKVQQVVVLVKKEDEEEEPERALAEDYWLVELMEEEQQLQSLVEFHWDRQVYQHGHSVIILGSTK